MTTPQARRNRQIAAYLFFAFCAVIGLLKVQHSADVAEASARSVRVENYQRSRDQCLNSNRARNEVKTTLQEIIALIIPKPNEQTDPERAQRINEFLTGFNKTLQERLYLDNCPPPLTAKQIRTGKNFPPIKVTTTTINRVTTTTGG